MVGTSLITDYYAPKFDKLIVHNQKRPGSLPSMQYISKTIKLKFISKLLSFKISNLCWQTQGSWRPFSFWPGSSRLCSLRWRERASHHPQLHQSTMYASVCSKKVHLQELMVSHLERDLEILVQCQDLGQLQHIHKSSFIMKDEDKLDIHRSYARLSKLEYQTKL